jgi:hypothetical protein
MIKEYLVRVVLEQSYDLAPPPALPPSTQGDKRLREREAIVVVLAKEMEVGGGRSQFEPVSHVS